MVRSETVIDSSHDYILKASDQNVFLNQSKKLILKISEIGHSRIFNTVIKTAF